MSNISTDLKFLCYIACSVATLSEHCSLFTEFQTLELTRLVNEKGRHGILKTYCARMEAELFYRGSTMIYGFGDASELHIDVVSTLARLAWSSVEPLQMTSNLMLYMFLGEEDVKEKKNRKFFTSTVKCGMESLNEENRSERRVRYPSAKELLVNNTELE